MDINNSKFINQFLTTECKQVDNVINTIVAELQPYLHKRSFQKKKDMLRIIILNFIECRRRGFVLAVSLGRYHYEDLNYNTLNCYTYRTVKQLIDALLKTGFIEKIKHVFKGKGDERNKSTKIMPEVKLSRLLYSLPHDFKITAKYPDPVFKRDEEGTMFKISNRNKIANEMRKFLKANWNPFIMHHDIFFDNSLIQGEDFLLFNEKEQNFLRGIYEASKLQVADIEDINCNNGEDRGYIDNNTLSYIGTLAKKTAGTLDLKALIDSTLHNCYKERRVSLSNGRFYTSGFGFQNIPSGVRKYITINGNRCTELDFKALHPTLLYLLEGSTCPADAYVVNEKEQPQLRKAVKFFLLILINAKNRREAIYAFNEKQPDLYNIAVKEYGSIDNFYNVIADFHKPINKYFCSDYGVKLQEIDGQIIFKTLQEFYIRKIPVLPIHDSVIVPKEHYQTAIEILANSFCAVAGEYPIEIDVKY